MGLKRSVYNNRGRLWLQHVAHCSQLLSRSLVTAHLPMRDELQIYSRTYFDHSNAKVKLFSFSFLFNARKCIKPINSATTDRGHCQKDFTAFFYCCCCCSFACVPPVWGFCRPFRNRYSKNHSHFVLFCAPCGQYFSNCRAIALLRPPPQLTGQIFTLFPENHRAIKRTTRAQQLTPHSPQYR